MRVASRVAVPALVITAEDDPFVPATPFREPALSANPNVHLMITRRGGHCGFLEAAHNGSDGSWAERTIVDFALGVTLRKT
jgi:predicted alpha/beta-fold hydrolase